MSPHLGNNQPPLGKQFIPHHDGKWEARNEKEVKRVKDDKFGHDYFDDGNLIPGKYESY